MSELISQAFRLVNFPFTLLLLLVMLYWLLVAFGALGGSESDADVHVGGHGDTDVDLDVDGDGDVDLHHHVEGHHSGHGHHETGSWWGTALKFVNLGEVPVMVVLSILILSLWTFGIVANFYWTGGNNLLALAFFAVNLVVSVIVTRYVTLPLKPLFRVISRQYDESVKIIGQHCRVVTSEATPEFGQAEITTTGVPLLIHVRTLNDATLRKGDIAVVVKEDAERRIFFITANPLPSNQ